MQTRRLVLLDKNFLQAEDRTTPRLRALARCGCEFVLIDTLLYELCSDRKLTGLWRSVQRKLFPYADRLHVWTHVSDLVKREVAEARPARGPEDEEATLEMRGSFRVGQEYVPSDLDKKVGEAREQRETATVREVAPMARAIGAVIDEAARANGLPRFTKDAFGALFATILCDERWVRLAIRGCYGNPGARDNYIPDAEQKLTPDWFAYHNARATLALIGVFLRNHGLVENPGKKLPNTVLDTDYLALLHYADALASDETTGDMAGMCKWLYGANKKCISSGDLFAATPKADEIGAAAYFAWMRRGLTHGRDLDDWLWAERVLGEQVWDQLGAFKG